jgi:hypothetical protein
MTGGTMESGLSYTGSNLIFIIGAPRSGTTWLQRLLASHPKIRTGQESKLFREYVGPQLRAWRWELAREQNSSTATGRGGTGLSCYFEEEHFLRILRGYMLQLLEPMVGNLQPGELFLEKTPSHALYIKEIKELLPESRFIHVLRDPRDVTASLLAAANDWGSGWAPRLPQKAAATWVRHVRAVRSAAGALTEREFFEVTYERLWGSTEETLSDLTNFLGLEWSGSEMRETIGRNQAQSIRSGKGTPIPLHGEVAKSAGPAVKDPATFVRRAQPGAWKSDLSFGEKLKVWRVVRKTMREVGYTW